MRAGALLSFQHTRRHIHSRVRNQDRICRCRALIAAGNALDRLLTSLGNSARRKGELTDISPANVHRHCRATPAHVSQRGDAYPANLLQSRRFAGRAGAGTQRAGHASTAGPGRLNGFLVCAARRKNSISIFPSTRHLCWGCR
jgi:hypothetical protein